MLVTRSTYSKHNRFFLVNNTNTGLLQASFLESCPNGCYMWKVRERIPPTIKNCALELPTFGVIVGVNPSGVQWKGLTPEEPPSWSWLTSAPGKYAFNQAKSVFILYGQQVRYWPLIFQWVTLDETKNFLKLSSTCRWLHLVDKKSTSPGEIVVCKGSKTSHLVKKWATRWLILARLSCGPWKMHWTDNHACLVHPCRVVSGLEYAKAFIILYRECQLKP